MLDLIRKKQKSMIIKVVFWGIIATFVGTIFLVWGKGSDDSGRGPGAVAASVNGTAIPYSTYQIYYDNRISQIQSLYGSSIPEALLKQFNLEEQSLNELIDRELMMQEAENRDIEVTRSEVIASIEKIPYFQENGVFSKTRYIAVLQAQRISAEQFEEEQRQSLRIDKLNQQIQNDIDITPADIENEFNRRNNKVRLDVLRYEPSRFEKQVAVNDEVLETYYADKREAYRVAEKISLAYLAFNAADLVDEATVSDVELEKYYRRNRGDYEVPEEVHAAHILITVPQDADQATRDAKRAEIDKILEQARAGEDFAALAKRYSEDSSKSQGGDLGFFPRGRMVKPFENAAFSLPVGEISDVVTSQYGYHIIKLLELTEARVKDLEEVRDEVTTGAKAQKARQLAFEKALDAYNLNRKGGSIEKAASDFDVALQTTPLFERGTAIPGLGNNPEIGSAAFLLGEEEIGRPVRDGDDTYLFAVQQKQPSFIPELKEVRMQVEQAYRSEQAKVLAEQAATDGLAALNDKGTLKQVARKTGALEVSTEAFSRADGDTIPGLGNNTELAEQAFNLTVEAPLAATVYPVGDAFVVATLKERTEADLTELDDAKREELRNDLLEKLKVEKVDEVVKALREQAEIVINLTFNKG
ncbi:MAG: hypothetical protein C0624_07225 [Desulfuromonas sp.]|nr:MAG: hypothetical protein C0624_07225 [Desulfuromonas sp.]